MNINEAFAIAIQFLSSLMTFCIVVGFFSFVMSFASNDIQLCGRLEGVATICAIIGVGIFGFLSSFIDQDYIDELRKELEDRLKDNKED